MIILKPLIMKKYLLLISIISFITLTSSMCEKEDDNSSSSSSNNISTIIQNGSWKISYFNDSGTDKTYLFSGYSFTFNNNGSVVAVNNSSSISGTWTKGSDDSSNKLYLTFSASPFEELTDDWHIIEQNSVKIRLEDVSGGNGGTDYLTFEKN